MQRTYDEPVPQSHQTKWWPLVVMLILGMIVGFGIANLQTIRIAWLKQSFRRTVADEIERGGKLSFSESDANFKQLIAVGGTDAGTDVLIDMMQSDNKGEAAVAVMFSPELGNDRVRLLPVLQSIIASPQSSGKEAEEAQTTITHILSHIHLDAQSKFPEK
ncbi:MAG: hypothetical protein KDA88_09605 [Planctomycetaceae bacterium]|nr:hypothetical protein [Planctomycetaceae bacterium]MCB9949625.1 hypothetical protein [Planctomycetaceae bacterium]